MAKEKRVLSIINPKDLEKALNSDCISSSSDNQIESASGEQEWASVLIAASLAIEASLSEAMSENKPKRKKTEESKKASDSNEEHLTQDADTPFKFLQLNENNSVTVFSADQALRNFLEDWGSRDRASVLQIVLGEVFDSV
jgi:hypothetical protein